MLLNKLYSKNVVDKIYILNSCKINVSVSKTFYMKGHLKKLATVRYILFLSAVKYFCK